MTTITGLTTDLVAGASRVMGKALRDLPCEENLFDVVYLKVIIRHFSIGMGTDLVALFAYGLPYALNIARHPMFLYCMA